MQNTLSRETINKDFYDYNTKLDYAGLCEHIDRAKNQLLEWGFKKGDHILPHVMRNDTQTLAFTFALLELGIPCVYTHEDMIEIAENEDQKEKHERIAAMFREIVRENNRFPMTASIDDKEDEMFFGKKKDVYSDIFQHVTTEFGVKHGHYMGNYKDASSEPTQPWDVSEDDVAHMMWKNGSGFGRYEIGNNHPIASYRWDDFGIYATHKQVLDKVNRSPIDCTGKVCGLSKTYVHENAFFRFTLPALMQSGRVVDMPIPEYNLGNSFIPGIKDANGNVITKELIYQFVIAYSCDRHYKNSVEMFVSPADGSIFEFLSCYKDKYGDFQKHNEILIHGEKTDEHLQWEKDMNLTFIYDGDEFLYGEPY